MDIREELIRAIKEEILGPTENPKYKDNVTGEEVLLRYIHGTPKARYGAGMLYPKTTENIGESNTEENSNELNNINEEELKENKKNIGKAKGEELDYEEPVGMANQFLPSAMGFTLRFKKNEEISTVILNVKSAHYIKGNGEIELKRVNSEGKSEIQTNSKGEPRVSDYWIRNPIKINPIKFNVHSFFFEKEKKKKIILHKNESGNDWLSLNIFDRSIHDENYITITFVLVNELEATGNRADDDSHILYQNELKLTTENENLIAAYKERRRASDTEEEEELNLLYRKKRIFGIGHGVSVEWENSADENSRIEKVSEIKTSVIPTYEMPQVAPTSHITLSMYELSDLGNWEDAKLSLNTLVNKYEEWIKEISNNSKNLDEDYQRAASNAIEKCSTTLKRIKQGVNLLTEASVDSNLVKSFRWMNRAMLWQQQRSSTSQRIWRRSRNKGSIHDNLDELSNGSQHFPSLKEFYETTNWGNWRPFQIAFVLLNLESVINPQSYEREIIDLIWFPTGGGKTEAYLGLSAFTIFFRRLKGKDDLQHDLYSGTTILMRYTLRLLTTQQYERAASLICACEIIRKELEEKGIYELGDDSISIGLWVGGSSTPNDNAKARNQYIELNNSTRFRQAPYNFVVMKCPCCSAQIGKIPNVQPNDFSKVKGLYKEDGKNGRILFKCENLVCEFYGKVLPLYVIDEQIYDNSPTMLLGTVDKFAMIPWKPEAGRLFGFREKGDERYRITPPELIIQDELHLISGPLGSMVGMYETLVQSLCKDYKLTNPPFINENNEAIMPKIIASSATISRAKEQINALYGTQKLHIFPSQGLEFGNTWFSVEKQVSKEYPGRLYAGIMASGYPSAQTAIVRSYSSVLQKVKELEENFKGNIDFYWTLLSYFNSIRELGGAMSLVHGDIRERLYQIQNRELVPYGHPLNRRRSIFNIKELTSRISSDKIPDTLKELERNHNTLDAKKSSALDICLASNMVATGVDISRLGLMFIHGQPKTTAEYIQASSRVGRKVPEGPGMIFTLYSSAKPRDKSQYEQFQGYHSRIYSNVEPTSVTPFSINVRERALHAIIIGLIRHFSSNKEGLLTKPTTNTDEFKYLKSIIVKMILDRCKVIEPEEWESTKKLCESRLYKWENIGYQKYGDAGNYSIKFNEEYPLMYASSSEVKMEIKDKSISTPTSMRGVDTESKISILNI